MPKSINNKHLQGYNIQKYIDKTGEKILCKLCPNNCIIADGQTGVCGVRMNSGGKLYSTIYGRPCSINIDPIEKKPLYHFFPGENILSIGTYGCNLSCKGCQNFDITRHDKTFDTTRLRYYEPEDIVKLALENDIKMIAYTYNEPTMFFEYMIDIAKLARKKGIKNVIVSNGYINPEPLKELSKYIDAANIDLKGMDDKFYISYCGARLNPVLETIKFLHKNGIWLEITNLLIKGLNDDKRDIQRLCGWVVENLGKDVPVHFSRFYPYHNASEISITPASILDTAREIAIKTGIRYVYIGNLGTLDNTLCSKCGQTIIEREYLDIKIKGLDRYNKCIKCGERFKGVLK